MKVKNQPQMTEFLKTQKTELRLDFGKKLKDLFRLRDQPGLPGRAKLFWEARSNETNWGQLHRLHQSVSPSEAQVKIDRKYELSYCRPP